MDTNSSDHSTDLVAPEGGDLPMPSQEASRPGVLRSSWDGAKTGARLTAYIAGVIAAIALVYVLVIFVLEIAIRPAWVLPSKMLTVMGFFLGAIVWGGMIGAVVGLFVGMIRRILPTRLRPNTSSMFERPIRLFPRKRNAVTTANTVSTSSFRRRWLLLCGFTLLAVIVAAMGTGIYLERRVNDRLNAAIAAADHDDPFWRIDDLMAHREAVADEENSARIVAEVVALLPESWPVDPKPPAGYSLPRKSSVVDAIDRLNRTNSNVRLDDETVKVIRDELKTRSEAVELARTVADFRTGRHELVLGPTLIDTLLTETQDTRSAARLLSADAALRTHDGDLDGALDSCRAILATGRSIGDEPFLISHLVRIAIGSVALQSTRRVLGQGMASEAAVARMQSLILDELSQPLLLIGMKGERATLTELIRRVGSGEVPISALSEGGASFDRGQIRKLPALGKLWFDYQRAVGLGWMNEAVAIAGRPVVEQPALWEAWDAKLDQIKNSRTGLYTATLPLLLIPGVKAASFGYFRHQGELGATATLLAAERQRMRTGSWPASIADIDPDILKIAPIDPFSGEPFRMEHRDGQLVIYSIGPNRRDEHGAYEPRKWMKGGMDDVGATGWDVSLRRQTAQPAADR